jgi:hypothetical protein
MDAADFSKLEIPLIADLVLLARNFQSFLCFDSVLEFFVGAAIFDFQLPELTVRLGSDVFFELKSVEF